MRYIIKASGEKEKFSLKKFRNSLLRSGASEAEIKKLVYDVEQKKELKTTHDIYKYALNYLKKLGIPSATKYNFKKALFELGPSGYPFEKFVARIFDQLKYKTFVSKNINGKCVIHEVDVLLEKEGHHSFVECKFHNSQGIKSNVKITLYIQARFEDIEASRRNVIKIEEVFAITNTKFTKDAIRYANCVGMNVIDWNYPRNGSLSILIDKFHLYPITILISLKKVHMKKLIQHNIVLCHDLNEHIGVLKQLHLKSNQIDQIIKELNGICM